MIRTHGRYPYSNITTRPVYDWPNGTRLAVYVAVNIEQFSFGEGKGAAIAPADQANSHSVYSWRDYGNRVGIWRMLELFDAFDIPIEAQMNLAVYEHCPDIPEPSGSAVTKSWVTASPTRTCRSTSTSRRRPRSSPRSPGPSSTAKAAPRWAG